MAAPRPIVPRVFVPSLTRIRSALFTLLVLIAAVPAADAASVVVGDGTDAHHSALPTDCANSGTAPCGLWDAITYLNSQSGPNNITFSVATVTLSADLPAIQVPVTIDGSFGAPRVVLDGGNTFSGINISDTAGGTTPGSGSTIENLVIQQMGSEGIAIVGGGNSVYNCYIGTDITGLIAMGNQGDGISITSTGAAFTFPPDLSATAGNAIGDPIDPTKGNLISGNTGIGVDIFGQRTVLNVVALNKIGTDKTGITGMANGSHGVAISGNAFGNTIGPGNIISGNSGVNADGINITGTVMAPNVVTANIIGPPSTIVLPALGNGRDGIRIDSTLFDVSLPDVAEIGPLNIIGQSGEDGIQITGSCQKVRVFGNFIGVAEDPNSAGTFIDIGNARDGIRVGTPGHQIGGTTLPETNVISANNDSGVYFVTTNATDTTIQGNIIGRDPLNLINFPNTKDGITFDNAGSNTVGGTASGEANVIAGNGREGIKLVNSSAWADLISGNSIFGNHILENGLGIDLDFTQEDVDPTDNLTPSQDPNTAYSNHGQNAPVVGTGVSAPHYDPATGHTVVNWTLETRSNAPITLEFFGSDAPGFNNHGEGQVYLGTVMVVTDGTGLASGSSDIAPPSAYDSRGKYITMTATDTTAETTRPGNTPIGPANNTSEFSNAVLVPNPGILQFSSPIYSVAENGVTATITVSRIGGSDTAVSVDYATSDGTATAPADYTTSTGTLNWADGDSADKTFTVPIVNDTTFEGSETVNLALSNPTAFAELGVPPAAILTITDDDTAPAISISDASQLEGNSGSSTMNFTVTLSNPSTQTVTVDFATADGTAATGDADYAAATGTVNFPPLSTSQQISVTINGDTKFEPDEAFNVNLTNPSNATIADNQGVGTIQNDDAQPTISITDVAQAEGNLGPTPFVFAVSLSNASSQTVSVNYTTTDGTATLADADYVSATGTITFPPGSTSQPLIVTVNGDTKFEADQTFTVDLSGPSNATIADNQGLGTIQNDDVQPSITITDVSQSEGNAGGTAFNFSVTLSNLSDQTVTVDYATADGSATTADGDYGAASGTLTFLPGTLSQPATVTVNGDTKFEPNETFTVTLSLPSNATIAVPTATGTIQNDDTLPSIAINDVTQNEGNSGTTAFIFTVTLSNPSSQSISVDYATADGTATTADPDYAAASGTLTFLPGSLTQQITVNVNGDTTDEPNETFFVNLTNPVNATIADNQGLGTIVNDDSTTPTFSISDVSQVEGNAGASTFTFTVTLAPISASAISVDANTSDGTATTADGDYAANSQTLTFNPGDASHTFAVTVNGDTKFEADETFTVTLSNNTGVSAIGIPTATGTIQNDDAIPSISISDVSLAEGNAGTTSFDFTVSLSNASDQTVTVDYATADGTATIVNSDYTAASGTLVFPPGVTALPLSVLVNGDTNNEPDETFVVNLTNPANATIVDNQGLGTIVNDDGTSSFAIGNVTMAEGNAGTTNFTFTVTLTPPSGSPVSVQAATSDGTATVADGDYTANTQTLNFGAGVGSQTFTVAVSGDTKFEPDETFTVTLGSNSVGTVIGTPTATGTIQNDDSLPAIAISDVSQNEGNAATTAFTFNVTLSNPSAQPVSVDFATADGTATIANTDYAATTGTLVFPPGSVTQPITVNVNGDTTTEPDETFFVNLTNPANATIADNQGLGTIVNDDAGGTPSFSIANVAQSEGDSGTTAFTFTVTLAPAAPSAVSVQAATSDGTATVADSDYVANTQTLNFAAGVTTQQFTVNVNGDTKFEADQTFTVTLSANSVGTVIGTPSATGTIKNDDGQPAIRIGSTANPEGNAGTTAFTFTVDLTNPSDQTITVDYATADGTATVADTDYTAAGGTVTFPPGSVSQPIVVQVNGDTTVEPTEAFVVNLTNPVNATIAGAQGTGTIINDDGFAIPLFDGRTLILLILSIAFAGIVALRRG